MTVVPQNNGNIILANICAACLYRSDEEAGFIGMMGKDAEACFTVRRKRNDLHGRVA